MQTQEAMQGNGDDAMTTSNHMNLYKS